MRRLGRREITHTGKGVILPGVQTCTAVWGMEQGPAHPTHTSGLPAHHSVSREAWAATLSSSAHSSPSYTTRVQGILPSTCRAPWSHSYVQRLQRKDPVLLSAVPLPSQDVPLYHHVSHTGSMFLSSLPKAAAGLLRVRVPCEHPSRMSCCPSS